MISAKYHWFISLSVEDAPTLELCYAAYAKNIISSYSQNTTAILLIL